MTMIDNRDKAQGVGMGKEARTLGLYIHVPFCVKKCGYCDFCSYPLSSLDSGVIESYVKKLSEEILAVKSVAEGRVIDTVYFGGGTPSLLSPAQLEALMSFVRELNVSRDAEITVECNPGTVSKESFVAMRSAGINRVSIGAQSFNDNELAALGRIHTAKEFERSFRFAREAGFDNISADLMYGIPEQTKDSFAYSIKKMCDLAPEHVSSYALSVEKGTPFAKKRNLLKLPTDDTVADMYDMLVDRLKDGGYERYEISNFSKSGRYSRHNMRYWKGEDYLGLGISAHSFFGGVRFFADKDMVGFLKADFSDLLESDIFCGKERISRHDLASEYVMLRMRLAEGLSLSEFGETFGVALEDFVDCDLSQYINGGYIDRKGDRIAFTTSGFCISNYILSDMISFEE